MTAKGKAKELFKKYSKGKDEHGWTLRDYEKQLNISDVIGSSIPKPPEPPLSRVLREGVGHFCTNCGSTVSKNGFLGIFGEMLCHNQKCPNSKSKKNCH